MELPYHLKNLKDSIEDLKIRKVCLDVASKCENEIEKIYFIDHDFYTGETGDAEDDNWDETKRSFLEKYDLNDDDYEVVWSDIEYICFDKDRFSKHDNEIVTEFKKIFPNLEEFKKDFKLYVFLSYFEEPEYHYKYEIEMKQMYINERIKGLRLEYPDNEIPNLDDL